MDSNSLKTLPGGELILEGISDLAEGRESIASLLVSIGGPRLRRLGLPVPAHSDPEMRLYRLLARQYDNGAHSKYNSYIRQLISFERAAECAS